MTAHNVDFAIFLKTLRRGIPPDAASLGPWKRLPARCGRRVTQEELAEAERVTIPQLSTHFCNRSGPITAKL